MIAMGSLIRKATPNDLPHPHRTLRRRNRIRSPDLGLLHGVDGMTHIDEIIELSLRKLGEDIDSSDHAEAVCRELVNLTLEVVAEAVRPRRSRPKVKCGGRFVAPKTDSASAAAIQMRKQMAELILSMRTSAP